MAALNYVLPYLARVPNRIERAEWVTPVAERLGVDDGLLLQELRRAIHRRGKELDVKQALVSPSVRESERRLLKIFLDNEEYRPDIAAELQQRGAHRGTALERVFEALLGAMAAGEPLEVAAVGEGLEEADKRLLYDIAFGEDGGGTLAEARDCLAALESRAWERQLKDLSKQIEAAERRQDAEEIARLAKLKLEMTQKWQEFRRQNFQDSFPS